MTIEIAGLPVEAASQSINRISLLLWGESGCGKTTFAATAPGRKLLINFDPNGPASIASRDDVDVLDLSDQQHKMLEKLRGEDPLGLSAVLKEGKYGTVMLDSVTGMSQLALERGVALSAAQANKGTPSSLEFPGLQGYGARTTVTVATLKSLLRLTGRYNVHFIATTHEDDAEKNDKGEFLFITMMLGGKIKNNVALQISEIWYMSSSEKDRKIAIRPCRGRKPMKTRMFRNDGQPEFVLRYDQDKSDEENTHTIAKWWDAWNASGKSKLPVPK